MKLSIKLSSDYKCMLRGTVPYAVENEPECSELFSRSVCYFETTIHRLSPTGVVAVGLALRDNRRYSDPYSYHIAADRQSAGPKQPIQIVIAKPREAVQYVSAPNAKSVWQTTGVPSSSALDTKSDGSAYSGPDVIGCGFDLERSTVFFTINGRFAVMADGFPLLDWYACIAVSPDCSASVNFGTSVCASRPP